MSGKGRSKIGVAQDSQQRTSVNCNHLFHRCPLHQFYCVSGVQLLEYATLRCFYDFRIFLRCPVIYNAAYSMKEQRVGSLEPGEGRQ